MARTYAYPTDLARYVTSHWPKESPLCLPWELLCEALSVAYQASMTTEEARPTRFRLLLMSPERLPEAGAPNEGVLRLEFAQDRPLSADELRRLSPAAPFETSLIGAHADHDKLRIWGLAHSGPAWLAPTWGGRNVVPNWSFDPIVHVMGPGQLLVRRAGKLVGALERGQLLDTTLDVFESEWLPELFSREAESIRARHAAEQARAPSPTGVESSLVGRVGQHMLRRAIQLIRNARHGGMILVLDDVSDGERDRNGLRLKYRLSGGEPSRRYRTLLFQILDQLAVRSRKPSVGWEDFALDESADLEKLEQAVFELSRVIAGMAAIDGAVVLDKQLGFIGFGAEVSAELPSPVNVARALDVEGNSRVAEAVENVGTRHRAAYRFVQHHARGLAIVISHDGAVSFVANRDGEVVIWQQSLSP